MAVRLAAQACSQYFKPTSLYVAHAHSECLPVDAFLCQMDREQLLPLQVDSFELAVESPQQTRCVPSADKRNAGHEMHRQQRGLGNLDQLEHLPQSSSRLYPDTSQRQEPAHLASVSVGAPDLVTDSFRPGQTNIKQASHACQQRHSPDAASQKSSAGGLAVILGDAAARETCSKETGMISIGDHASGDEDASPSAAEGCLSLPKHDEGQWIQQDCSPVHRLSDQTCSIIRPRSPSTGLADKLDHAHLGDESVKAGGTLLESAALIMPDDSYLALADQTPAAKIDRRQWIADTPAGGPDLMPYEDADSQAGSHDVIDDHADGKPQDMLRQGPSAPYMDHQTPAQPRSPSGLDASLWIADTPISRPQPLHSQRQLAGHVQHLGSSQASFNCTRAPAAVSTPGMHAYAHGQDASAPSAVQSQLANDAAADKENQLGRRRSKQQLHVGPDLSTATITAAKRAAGSSQIKAPVGHEQHQRCSNATLDSAELQSNRQQPDAGSEEASLSGTPSVPSSICARLISCSPLPFSIPVPGDLPEALPSSERWHTAPQGFEQSVMQHQVQNFEAATPEQQKDHANKAHGLGRCNVHNHEQESEQQKHASNDAHGYAHGSQPIRGLPAALQGAASAGEGMRGARASSMQNGGRAHRAMSLGLSRRSSIAQTPWHGHAPRSSILHPTLEHPSKESLVEAPAAQTDVGQEAQLVQRCLQQPARQCKLPKADHSLASLHGTQPASGGVQVSPKHQLGRSSKQTDELAALHCLTDQTPLQTSRMQLGNLAAMTPMLDSRRGCTPPAETQPSGADQAAAALDRLSLTGPELIPALTQLLQLCGQVHLFPSHDAACPYTFGTM